MAGFNSEPFLIRKGGQTFYNTSAKDLRKLMGDPEGMRDNLFVTSKHSRLSVRAVFIDSCGWCCLSGTC